MSSSLPTSTPSLGFGQTVNFCQPGEFKDMERHNRMPLPAILFPVWGENEAEFQVSAHLNIHDIQIFMLYHTLQSTWVYKILRLVTK